MTAPLTALLRKDKRPLSPGSPEKWDVLFKGDLIVSRNRDPEHAACRALLAQGITGKVTFIHESGMAGLTMDIGKSAGLTVDDSTRTGRPRLAKFKPYRPEGSSPASVLAEEVAQ